MSISSRPYKILLSATLETPSYPPVATSCGFATLLGPSNSGKSTLLNSLIGQKVAIVTPKVQTTRCRIAGIATYDSTQVIFLDTPGIFSATNRLSRAMVKSAWKSGRDGDTVSIILDIAEMFHEARRAEVRGLYIPKGVEEVLDGISERRKRHTESPLCVCANKIDAIPEADRPFVYERLRSLMEEYGLREDIDLLPISARHGEGIDTLKHWVTKRMPIGPWLYPEDDLTDMPARQVAAEVCREKAFMILRQELPYEIAIDTTSYKELKDGSIRITQDILVARNSQKRIVTGRGGAVVKAIGSRAREELAEVLGAPVHLMLTVKVKGKWKEEKSSYDQWGLDYNA